ncbi:MAG: helix-turn-helix domain-containing protein [Firmicutes bacterium]|nr:helix-turn-helix domain-containing protein [Bacillota bacterium]
MSSISFNEFVKRMRNRKGISTLGLKNASDVDDLSVSRLEKGERHPYWETLQNLFTGLDIPLEQFFLPLLENESEDIYILVGDTCRCLEDNTPQALILAEKNIKILEARESFIEGRNRQVLLSFKARLYALYGEKAEKIMPLLNEAMNITYENFDVENYDFSIMFLEESELLHTLAMVYAGDEKLKDAITLLKKLLKGKAKAPIDAFAREKQEPSIFLTLAKLLIQDGDYRQAVAACLTGYHKSCRRSFGQYTPDFMHILGATQKPKSPAKSTQ